MHDAKDCDQHCACDHAAHASSDRTPSETAPGEGEAAFYAVISRDLELLALLHDREPTAELIETLRAVAADGWFGLKAMSQTTQRGSELLAAALAEMPKPLVQQTLDELAVDYANIYLVHAYRAPPTESPWLDQDKLERQQPMFDLAEWYRRHGLAAADRQVRSDDHLVLQLQFLSHLFARTQNGRAAEEAAHFMDAHILRWFGRFSEIIATRCMTPYFAGLVTLTHGYLEDLRDCLVKLADAPRPVEPAKKQVTSADYGVEPEQMRYIPGTMPSW